jgi:hypothetical protein
MQSVALRVLYVIFKAEKWLFNPTNSKYGREIPRSTNNNFVLAHWNYITEKYCKESFNYPVFF